MDHQQRHRAKPTSSIFKLCRDFPMNSWLPGKKLQDTCFCSKHQTPALQKLAARSCSCCTLKFQIGEVLESFWNLVSNHCFGFIFISGLFWIWSPTKWEMYGTGAPKPYKGCRSQIFWMNLHFDDEEQRQFHLSGWEPYNQMIVVLWDYRRDWCADREKEFMCGLWMLFANAKYVEQKMHQTELFKEKIPNGTFQHIRLKFT